MIELGDEELHAAGEQPKWSESFYFNFHDRSTGVSGLTRLGIRPHDGEVDGGWLLFLGGHRVAIQQLTADLADMDGLLAVGPASYGCEAPMREWRLTSTGQALVVDLAGGVASGLSATSAEIELDLAFTATLPPEPIGATLGRAFGGIGHYDQAGTYRGSLRVDNEHHLIDGLGLRDHTWGVRDWRAPQQWAFFSAVFEPDVAVCASRIVLPNGDLRGGWSCDSGITSG